MYCCEKESTRKTEEKLAGWYKEGHERKKPKWRPVERYETVESRCRTTHTKFLKPIYIYIYIYIYTLLWNNGIIEFIFVYCLVQLYTTSEHKFQWPENKSYGKKSPPAAWIFTVSYKRVCESHHNYFFFWRNSPPVGQGFLIHEVSRSHTVTHHSR